MGDSDGGLLNSPLLENLGSDDYLSVWKSYGAYGILGAVIISIIIPILLSAMFMGKTKGKQRGVPVEVGGEAGYAVRNAQVTDLVEVPWQGATTMAALFEQSCKKNSQNRYLGTRKLISKEFITASDGRKFEKVHLGDYEWQTYGDVFGRVCNFASGLVRLGHNLDSRAAIFSETRAEWFMALQVCLLSYFYSEVGSLFFFSFPLHSWMRAMLKRFPFWIAGLLSTEYHCCYYLCFSRGGCPDPLT